MSNASPSMSTIDPDPGLQVPVLIETVIAPRSAVRLITFARGQLPDFARRRGLGPYLAAIIRHR